MTQYHELKGVPLDAYNKCCNEILRRSQEQLGLPREEIILRDLRSDDLGVTGKWRFSVTTTSGWNNLVNTYTVADNRFICISGIFTEMGTPTVHSIRITRAGSVARWWNVQRVGLQDDNEMHIDDPINRNIYVSNLHDDFANILQNHKWVKVNKTEFFNEFVSTKGKILYKSSWG